MPYATDDLVFHDCGTWSIDQGETGGCDGSLILAEEFTRPENKGLENISGKLRDIAQKWEVGVGDLIVFASSVAVVTCPLGPVVSFPFRQYPLPTPRDSTKTTPPPSR